MRVRNIEGMGAMAIRMRPVLKPEKISVRRIKEGEDAWLGHLRVKVLKIKGRGNPLRAEIMVREGEPTRFVDVSELIPID